MSDDPIVAPANAAPTAGDQTAGMLLRAAREASGMQISTLAVAMKVPVKKLEALEADRLDELPDAVFVRALAASVCRTLKLDPADVLSRLPQSVRPQLDSNERGINMPLSDTGFLGAGPFLGFVSRPPVLIVIALLLAVLAVLFVPDSLGPTGVQEAQTTAMPAPPVPEVPQSVKEGKVVLAPVESAVLAEPVASAPAAAARKPEASAAVALPVKPVASATQPATPGAAVNGLVVFKAKATAWVRVRDSKGVIQFEKTLAAGESAAASGETPLSVVVGNVAATEVLVRGQPFSLDELNQNNVARFEVK